MYHVGDSDSIVSRESIAYGHVRYLEEISPTGKAN